MNHTIVDRIFWLMGDSKLLGYPELMELVESNLKYPIEYQEAARLRGAK